MVLKLLNPLGQQGKQQQQAVGLGVGGQREEGTGHAFEHGGKEKGFLTCFGALKKSPEALTSQSAYTDG